MAARLYKIIKVCTGAVPTWDGKRTIKRQREIGVVIEHEARGNTWLELRLHGDILNPVLYQQVKGQAMPAGDSMFIATLADPPRRLTDGTVSPEEEGPPSAEEAGGDGE